MSGLDKICGIWRSLVRNWREMDAKPKVALIIFVLFVTGIIWLVLSSRHDDKQAEANYTKEISANAETERKRAANPPMVSRPSGAPPKFRVYKANVDGPTTIIVATKTTDDQLRSLLWTFREKVRAREFTQLGLTSKAWNGVDSGMLVVYKGEKCADEEDNPSNPCGHGEHDDAYYQWGLDGDVNRDAGYIRQTGKDDVLVFDYKDGWELPPEAKGRLDSREQDVQTQRELFAKLLQDRVTGMGFEMAVSTSVQPKDELHIDADMFKDTATRVQFINSVLPSWNSDLCNAGFRSIKLTQGGFLESGKRFSLRCR